jgi:hypothetical protein
LQWAQFKERLRTVDPEAKALKDEPVLNYAESHYMRVFTDLSRSRPVGMGVSAIPISEIKAYCEMFGITDLNERADLLFIIQQMDEEFMNYCNSKNNK